jgi:hypothetical protein
MGLERMLLAWAGLMAFVVLTSLSFLAYRGVAAQVLRYLWLPFALAGVVWSSWRYYTRLNSLQKLYMEKVPIGSDPLAYALLILLLFAVLLSALILAVVQNKLL